MTLIIAVGVALVAGWAAGRAPRPWWWLLPAGVTGLPVVVAMAPIAAAGLGGSGAVRLPVSVGAWVAGLVLVGLLVRWLAVRGWGWLAAAVGLVVRDVLELLPVVLTAVTAFVLAAVHRAARARTGDASARTVAATA